MVWTLVIGLAALMAALGVRILMLGEAMIRSIAAADPSFRPNRFHADRGWVLKEYRQRFPAGVLATKIRHVEWAIGVVFLAFVLLAFVARTLPH